MSGMKDGGPAFPVTTIDLTTREIRSSGGLTKREWFAGMAMIGILSGGKPPKINNMEMSVDDAAYLIADRMIARAEKK